MLKQAKFYDLPPDEIPVNRRVYNAAKKPFAWLWEFLRWVGQPFALALPFAMLSSAAVTIWLSVKQAAPLFTGQVAWDIFSVGLVWTVYLGAVFLVVKLVAAIVDN